MSDDSFFREVDEELRSETLQNFWSRYGKILIGLAVAVVLGVAGWNYMEYSRNAKAAATGDAFMSAVQLAEEGKQDEAIAALGELEGDSSPTYRALARLRSASELASKNEKAKALEAFDAVAADDKVDSNLRSIARLRAGYLMVDEGTLEDVQTRVAQLTSESGPYRFSAQEVLGLAHFKAGDLQKAHDLFAELAGSTEVPRSMRQRLSVMLGLIASRGGPVYDAQATPIQ